MPALLGARRAALLAGPRLTRPLGLAAQGDSITYGYLLSSPATQCYPAQFAAAAGLPFSNQGVTGKLLQTMDSEYASVIAPLFDPRTLNTVSLLGGINDLLHTTGMTDVILRGYAQSFCAKARATGFRIAIGTLLPVGSGQGWNSTLEGYRVAYNAWLRSTFGGLADYLMDFDGSATLSDPNSTTYYTDGLHPTAAGAAVMAEILRSALGVPPPASTPAPSGSIQYLQLGQLTNFTPKADGAGYDYTATTPATNYQQGQTAISSKSIPAGADGFIGVTLAGTAVTTNNGPVIGLRSSATASPSGTGYQGFDFWIAANAAGSTSGFYYGAAGNSNYQLGGGPTSAGMIFGLRRVGTKVTAEIMNADGSVKTVINTWTGVDNSVPLYFALEAPAGAPSYAQQPFGSPNMA